MWRDVMLLSYVGGNSELWGMLGLWDRYFGPWGSPTLKRRRRLSTETFLQRFNGDVYIIEILCVKISRVLETDIYTNIKFEQKQRLCQVRSKFDSFALR